MRSGQYFPQRHSVPRNNVNGSTFWHTPRASTGRHGIALVRARSGEHRGNLEDYLAWQHVTEGGTLRSGYLANPQWIEWLQGFPDGYTDFTNWGTR